MEFSEVVKKRRSIREYEVGAAVSNEDVKTMLTAAMCAPSACNTRPWEFYVIRDRRMLESIAEIHPFAKQVLSAGTAIVVVARPDRQQGAGEGYWPQDCGAAIENLLLSAADLGYGTCWCGLYPRQERMQGVKSLLKTEGIPVAVISVGTAAQTPEMKGFYEESKVTFL